MTLSGANGTTTLAMLTIKQRGREGRAATDRKAPGFAFFAGVFLVLALFLSACTPPGPRALLKGKKKLESGRYSEAIVQLETATSLLETNAHAWNYLGLAYHGAGRAEDASRAYQRALSFDRTLAEARYNLGSLYLEQDKLEAAKLAFTAYTLDRQNSPDGFLKLGSVLLRTGDLGNAEKAYQSALRLAPNNPEALTGVGVIRHRKGQGMEAAQYFAAALKHDPHYGPALLNYGILAQEVLHDRILAVGHLERYLALKPTPSNAQAVSNVLLALQKPRPVVIAQNPPPSAAREHPGSAPVSPPVAAPVTPQARTPDPAPQTNAPQTAAPLAKPEPPRFSDNKAKEPPRPAPVERVTAPASPSQAPAQNPGSSQAAAVGAPPARRADTTEVVTLQKEPELRAARDVVPPKANAPASSSASQIENTATQQPKDASSGSASPGAVSTAAPVPRRGILQKINPLNVLGRADAPAQRPPSASSTAGARSPGSESTEIAQGSLAARPQPLQPETTGPSYRYLSPPKPAPGNNAQAERVFAQGVKAHREHRTADAMAGYREAIQLDPALFGAHFNLGLIAVEMGDFPTAFRAYETALAIRPESLDARYNFALLLKQSGFAGDSVRQLERLISHHPKDARAHVMLGNLYSQQFRNVPRAREHYLKAIEFDPKNPQAGAIRFWLMENPG